MRISITLLVLSSFFSCQENGGKSNKKSSQNQIASNRETKPWPKYQFDQNDTLGVWQYHFPFSDSSYVFAIHYAEEQLGELITGVKGENTNVYFAKVNRSKVEVLWKKHLFTHFITDQVAYEDYNQDGVKDLVYFNDTGGRGGNAYYSLYLVNPTLHTLVEVENFDKIVNPSFDKKHKLIVSYGLTGVNYYCLYKLSQKNLLYQVGEPFDDNEELDLDSAITKILTSNPKLTPITSHE